MSTSAFRQSGDVNGDGAIASNSSEQISDTPNVLSFQRLDVYKCAVRFLALSTRLLATLPRGNAPLADQLRRASLSVPLNIAEAAGRTTEADAAHHYAIARGSAMECAAILDALHVLELAEETTHAEAVDLLTRIVAMTTKLCR